MKGILEGVQEINTFADSASIYFVGGKLVKDIPAANGQVLTAGTRLTLWVNLESSVAQFQDENANILAAFDLKVELVAR